MKTKEPFPLDEVIQGLMEKSRQFFLRKKRMFFILGLIALLYFFVILIYQVSSEIPQEVKHEQISELYLIQYINGWREPQQDFDVQDMRFGEKFLSELKRQAPSIKGVLLSPGERYVFSLQT